MDNPITWAILVALLALVGWVSRVTLAFGRIEGTAKEARGIAESAKQEVTHFNTGLAALNAAFNLFQVTAAEKYITRDILKEFEDRLLESRRETTEAIRSDIKELRNRIEQLSRPNGRRAK